MEKLTCSRFIDMYEEEVGDLMQEMYYDSGLNTDKLMNCIERWARDDDYELSDIDSFDYDKYLTNFYNCLEKGLS